MSPDTAIGQLAQRVAKLEQRMDDLASRAIERFSELSIAIRDHRSESASDMLRFGAMLQDHSAMRADLRHLAAAVAALEARLDAERDERIKGQRERREEHELARQERDVEIARMKADAEKQYAELQNRASQQRLENRRLVFGLAGIFLTSAAAVVAQVLGAGGS